MNQFITADTQITNYLMFPRGLIELRLCASELMIYMLLLDRCRLSARSADWRDREGNIFLYYPVRELSLRLGCSEAAVKNAMKKLEKRGLIAKKRQGLGKPNRIYVSLPREDGQDHGPRGHEAGHPEVVDNLLPEVSRDLPTESSSAIPAEGKETHSPSASRLSPNKNYIDKTTEQAGGIKRVFGVLHNLTLTAEEALEVAKLPDGERCADRVGTYMGGGWRFPEPMKAIRALARGVPMEALTLDYPFTRQPPGPFPGRPPSYP